MVILHSKPSEDLLRMAGNVAENHALLASLDSDRDMVSGRLTQEEFYVRVLNFRRYIDPRVHDWLHAIKRGKG